LRCKNCGDQVEPRQVELGYDYCLKEECQQRCLKRVLLASVAVNKAADYYTKAEEVVSPRMPATAAVPADDEEPPAARKRASRPANRAATRSKTTLERLREQEIELDKALDCSFERFRRGEVTAREMDRERDRLVESFNRLVMSDNIRYRSMMRPRSNGVR
jgi:hypothetical protein